MRKVMKTKILGGAMLGLAALMIVGCGGKKETAAANDPSTKLPEPAAFTLAAGQEATLFPFEVGNEWVYEATVEARDNQGRVGSGTQEFIFRVVKVVDVPEGGKMADIEIISNGTVIDFQQYLSNSTGLYQVSVGIGDKNRKFDPPQTILTFPIQNNSTYSWKGKGPISGNMVESSLEGKVLEPIEVTTKTGTLNALQVEQKQSWDAPGAKGTMESSTFWAPGIGLVRLIQGITGENSSGATKLLLKSHRIGKGPSEDMKAATATPEAGAAAATGAPSPGTTPATPPTNTTGVGTPSSGSTEMTTPETTPPTTPGATGGN